MQQRKVSTDTGSSSGAGAGQGIGKSYSISNSGAIANNEVKYPNVTRATIAIPKSKRNNFATSSNNSSSSSSSISSSNTSINENPKQQEAHFPKSYRMNNSNPEQQQQIENTGVGTGAGSHTKVLSTLDNLPPGQHVRLSFIQKLLIASGHVMNDLCASLWFTYGLLYLKKVAEGGTGGAKGPTSYAAIALTIGQFVDGIATPIVGYEADHFTNCCLCDRGYGRFKSWHLIGSILVILSFPFIYSPCIGCYEETSNLAKFFYYTSFISVFQIGWATVQVSHLALIPKMHPDELVRTELFSRRYAFTVIANIIIFLMTWFTLGNGGDCKIGPSDKFRFMMIGLIAIGIGALFTLAFQIFVKEYPDPQIKSNVSNLVAKKQLIRRLSSSPGFYDPDQLGGLTVGCSTTNPSSTGTARRRHRTRSSSINSIGGCGSQGSACDLQESHSGTIVQIHHAGAGRAGENAIPISNSSRERNSSGSIGAGSSVLDLDALLNVDDSLRLDRDNQNPQLSTVGLAPERPKMRIRDWFSMPQFYVGAFVYMCTRLSVNLGQVYMPLYVQDFLELPCNTVATVPLVMYISGFLVSMGIKFLNKLLGRQFAYTVGASLSILAASLILLLDWEDETNRYYIIYVVAVFLGGGSSAILVTSLSITADIIGANIENGAFVYGVFSFTDKVSCGIAIMSIDLFLPCELGDVDASDHSDKACLKKVGKYYQGVLGYATGGSAILGIFAVLFLTFIIHIRNQKLRQAARESESEYEDSDGIGNGTGVPVPPIQEETYAQNSDPTPAESDKKKLIRKT